MKKLFLVALAGFPWLFGCSENNRKPAESAAVNTEAIQPALTSFTADDILKHTKVLASDAYEGRAPGTKGEDSSVAYLTRQFKQLGLAPGNPNGTYIQDVPLYGFAAQPTASFTANGKKINLSFPNDYVAFSHQYKPRVTVTNSDMVFVGYGIVAPEYGWDDYKGVDVKGKTIVMLVNDPPIPDGSDTSKLDSKMFGGRAMTYYGRWTYKYEIASEKGAAAAIIIHETEPAGYPYEVVSGSNSRENVDIQTPDKNAGQVAVKSWITTDKAKELFAASGQDFAKLKKMAIQKDFKPVALSAKANFDLKLTLRELKSHNVIAKLEGSDPKLKDEYVVYTAHWDHLGKDLKLTGDQIYNGALDNATGTAGLLELAEAYKKLPEPPKRSILFLAVTSEEKGLLGSKYYAANPLYPLNKTLADINMDVLNAYGRTKDVIIIGYGNSTLDDILAKAAQTQNRKIVPEATPEKGSFYRSDHFEFAKQGVPALYAESGEEAVDKPQDYFRKKAEAYTANDYHKVSDDIKTDWDFSGAVQDLQLYFLVGYDVAQGDRYPEWKPGTEFKAKREAMLKQQ
ncbi:M28 family metallopeptidase [Adhaeribacter radiodurans]|uniref:M28 family peptidase n=1 Tax=Adhaeribacter radiodurans TaxID=2745197 RepID=A0A7L7LDD1_9BACT|nr:M28 family metallopeptidase [Adhaeribacter radiodurans]QMU30704.1 M28 family peptidase [Adhaeribacter radiodurans]